MPINKNELTKELDLTQEEAEAYMSEIDDLELDSTQLRSVAGGGCYGDCVKDSMSGS